MENQEPTHSLPNHLLAMTKADWVAFRHSPGHKLLATYLLAYQEALRREAWEALKAGNLDSKFLTELAVRGKMAEEISDLQFESIEAFYGVEREEENASS